MSKYTRNVLIIANLSYKKPYISERDKINVIYKIIFHFTNFSVHSKIIFMYMYTGAHREDHCSSICQVLNIQKKKHCFMYFWLKNKQYKLFLTKLFKDPWTFVAASLKCNNFI